MSEIISKYKTLLYLAILGGGIIGEVYSMEITVSNDITIGDSTKGNNDLGIDALSNSTDYNYWEDSNTYVFNSKYWYVYNTVTINNDYTLKLITHYTDGYYMALECYNTFTNNGNVIIDNYGILSIDYKNNTTISDSNNDGTIDINNGRLYLDSSAILTNTNTITLQGSSYIYIKSTSTLTNTGTIDISNITDLSNWGNYSTFTLEEGSIFMLPKSITMRIDTSWWKKPITLKGTHNNPVIFKYYTHEPYIDNNNIRIRPIHGAFTYTSLDDITTKTGFTFTGNNNYTISNLTLSDILTIDSGIYNSTNYTLDISQLGIIPTIDSRITTINTKLIIPRGYTLTVKGNITVKSNWDVKGTIKGSNNITYTKGSSTVKGGNVRGNVKLKGGKIVFR